MRFYSRPNYWFIDVDDEVECTKRAVIQHMRHRLPKRMTVPSGVIAAPETVSTRLKTNPITDDGRDSAAIRTSTPCSRDDALVKPLGEDKMDIQSQHDALNLRLAYAILGTLAAIIVGFTARRLSTVGL